MAEDPTRLAPFPADFGMATGMAARTDLGGGAELCAGPADVCLAFAEVASEVAPEANPEAAPEAAPEGGFANLKGFASPGGGRDDGVVVDSSKASTEAVLAETASAYDKVGETAWRARHLPPSSP